MFSFYFYKYRECISVLLRFKGERRGVKRHSIHYWCVRWRHHPTFPSVCPYVLLCTRRLSVLIRPWSINQSVQSLSHIQPGHFRSCLTTNVTEKCAGHFLAILIVFIWFRTYAVLNCGCCKGSNGRFVIFALAFILLLDCLNASISVR